MRMNDPTKPWRNVTSADVRNAIAGSYLERLVTALEGLTEPRLPIEFTLPKAIAMAGLALSQPVELYHPDAPQEETIGYGVEWAKFVINTAGGQVCNIWALIVAPSGSCKDIGGIPEKVAARLGIYLGTSGSAEGLADAIRDNGAGLLTISEFSPYLDKSAWQSKAQAFLTACFNQGHFKVNLAKRSGNREARYAYPSIIANIQPAVLREYADTCAIESGFLPRFLMSTMTERHKCRPATGDIDLSPVETVLKAYMTITGHVNIPDGYLQELYNEFHDNEAPLASHWQRLVNEYGPRFAVMLAVDGPIRCAPEIKTEHWEKAAVIIRWFYSMAESVIMDCEDDEAARRFEKHVERIYAFIRRHPKCQKTEISHGCGRGTTSDYRQKILDELVERGRVTFDATRKRYQVAG